MGFLKNLFGKEQENKYSRDGYLLPQYWQCMICKGKSKDIQADVSVRTGLFRMAIQDEDCYQDLSENERELIIKYFNYLSDPVGGKDQPSNTDQFEDTAGLSRDSTGDGFDAVYLCETHMKEVKKAIKNSANK